MLNQAQELIFERYKHPLFAGTVEGATHAAEGANPVCGDELALSLLVQNSTIRQALHLTRACAVCTAAADLLCEKLTGITVAEAGALDSKEQAEALGIPLSPVRFKCAVLPLETLKLAMKD